MPAITHPPQTRPHGAPSSYQAQPARWRITALPRHTRQLILALTSHVRRLRLPRPDGYKLEPMPRMRWYS
jgi:hypothetical protein